MHDPNVWIEAASTRDEPTIDLQYELTLTAYTTNRKMIGEIRKAQIGDVKEWTQFVNSIGTTMHQVHLDSSDQWTSDVKCKLVIPQELRGFQDSFIVGLFPWIQFLKQTRLQAYYNKEEGIGVKANIVIEQGELIPELSGQLHFVGDIAKTPYPNGMRWSFFGHCYMSGPVSIINCSCPKHRNVNMRPVSGRCPNNEEMEVVSEWSLNK